MQFTKKERLNLINQYKILSKLYPEDSEHYDELREILEDGYEVFIHRLVSGLVKICLKKKVSLY